MVHTACSCVTYLIGGQQSLCMSRAPLFCVQPHPQASPPQPPQFPAKTESDTVTLACPAAPSAPPWLQVLDIAQQVESTLVTVRTMSMQVAQAQCAGWKEGLCMGLLIVIERALADQHADIGPVPLQVCMHWAACASQLWLPLCTQHNSHVHAMQPQAHHNLSLCQCGWVCAVQ